MNASNPELPTMYVCINSRAYSHYTLFPIREKQAQEEKVIDPKTPAHNSDTRLLTFSQDCEKYINFFPNAEHFSLKLSTVGLKHKNIKLFFYPRRCFKDKFPGKLLPLYTLPYTMLTQPTGFFFLINGFCFALLFDYVSGNSSYWQSGESSILDGAFKFATF